MRTSAIAAIGFGCLACGTGTPRADTVAARDSSVVAGPPAAPSTPPSTPPSTQAVDAGRVPGPAKTSSRSDSRSNASEARVDSVRGVVSVVGTSFDKRVMIAERGTSRRLEVVGPLATVIGHIAGVELTATGSLSGSRLDVARFLVRSVDGQPAIDGKLVTENGSLYIVTDSGARTRIATPPPPLVGHDGARVWITGDPARGVSSFGFIDPPR
jgi:hypothetical protein